MLGYAGQAACLAALLLISQQVRSTQLMQYALHILFGPDGVNSINILTATLLKPYTNYRACLAMLFLWNFCRCMLRMQPCK